MKIEVHVLNWNELEILPYTVRHYLTFARVIIHDAGSTDGSPELARVMGAEVRPWAAGEKFNDLEHMALKNSCWKGTDADFVAVVDADELLYFPGGAQETLGRYLRIGAAVIKPAGYEMFNEDYPTTTGQIYDEVKMGTCDDTWYSKPCLFSPARVMESGFGIGAHESRIVLKDGRSFHVGPNWPKANPPTLLLHFHHGIGPIERLARRLDEKTSRLSATNKANGWGNLKPGMVHAKEKLDFIKAGLQQVIT